MRKFFTSICLAAVAIPAFCQITLTQATYPMPTDTVTVVDVSTQVTSVPAMGNNKTWNYTSLTPGTAYLNLYAPVSGDANFPAAQFMVKNLLKGLTPALGYYFDQYYEITSTGANVVGMHVPAQSYSLAAFTGNSADTLYILDTILYFPATPRPIVAFPATAGSAWHSALRHAVNMQLTVTAASLNKTPMQQIFYLNRFDTIVGWGTLQLPAVAGFNSTLPVLQNLITQYAIDSFYIGGAPAPGAITTPFGITQGQRTGPIYNRMVFYREGAFNYQMALNFKTPAFDTVTSVYVSTALPLVTGITDIAATDVSSIYPNPVSGHNFTIRVDQAERSAAIHIEDMSGRTVVIADVKALDSKVSVSLDKTLPEGIYIYSIKDNNGAILSKGKIVSAL